MRAVYLAVSGFLLGGPALAQDFNPTPFIQSMVEVRRMANTCEPFMNGSPVQASLSIDMFLETLGQPPVTLVDSPTRNSLSRFIRQHAASLCVDKLNQVLLAYNREASRYESGRPEEWPPAPGVLWPTWCADPNCGEMR